MSIRVIATLAIDLPHIKRFRILIEFKGGSTALVRQRTCHSGHIGRFFARFSEGLRLQTGLSFRHNCLQCRVRSSMSASCSRMTESSVAGWDGRRDSKRNGELRSSRPSLTNLCVSMASSQSRTRWFSCWSALLEWRGTIVPAASTSRSTDPVPCAFDRKSCAARRLPV